jgi:hypothetical protein
VNLSSQYISEILRFMRFSTVPSISVVVQDVDHCTGTLHLTYLAAQAIMPEFHSEKQRYSTVPCVIERQMKVSATASEERRRRNEKNIVSSG